MTRLRHYVAWYIEAAGFVVLEHAGELDTSPGRGRSRPLALLGALLMLVGGWLDPSPVWSETCRNIARDLWEDPR